MPDRASGDTLVAYAAQTPRPPAETLTSRQQTRNAICYALIVSISYLTAPVCYVGLMHAALCHSAGASKMVANLPTSMAAFFGLAPLVAAWLFPYTRWIKPVMSYGYALSAVGGLIVPIVLICPTPNWLRIAAAILHAAVLLACNGTAGVFMWEAVIRGTTEGKRGKTFSIAFGIGPFFAVASSVGAQFVLNRGPYPYNFAIIFLTGSVLLLVNAVVARRFVIPSAGEVIEREAFGAFFVGGLRSFFASRTLVLLAAAYLLFYTALVAMNNALLNVKHVLDVQPQEMAGWCSALRFGTKGLAGVFLGLLLARYGARSPAVATAIVLAVANLWTMFVPGTAYLIAFGLFGAGELGGLYYPHYVAAASRPDRLKRNICIYQIIGTFGTLSAALLGFVADRYGMTASAGLALGAAVLPLLIFAALPARPEPEN